jgi:hypothetical protein
MLFAVVASLACWSSKCAATSMKKSRHAQSPPSHSSTPADLNEHEEPVDDEADSDYDPGEDEDEEADGDGDGDGDDYPGDDLIDELDELEKEVEDAFSPSEDPPPPPEPPSQSHAADPDSKPEDVPFWYLLFLGLLCVTTVSLVKWAFLRLRGLRSIKVYTGTSFLNLFIYIEDQSCSGLVRTSAISSLAGAAGFVAPFQLEEYDVVRRAVELDNASLLEVLQLPPVLKVMAVLAVVVVGILIDKCWRTTVGIDGEVIPFSLFRIFVF